MELTSQDIFDAINKIRENPNLVINQIKEQLKRFESSSVYRTKRDAKIRTVSGKAGWQDAVLALERQKPKGNLNWNPILAQAAEEYRLVAIEDNSISPFDVLRTFCSYEGNISFNINQSDAEQDLIEIVAAMIVGDGDQKQGTRTAIYHPLYRQFACSVNQIGNKSIIYTIFAERLSAPTTNQALQQKQTNVQEQVDNRPIGGGNNQTENHFQLQINIRRWKRKKLIQKKPC